MVLDLFVGLVGNWHRYHRRVPLVQHRHSLNVGILVTNGLAQRIRNALDVECARRRCEAGSNLINPVVIAVMLVNLVVKTDQREDQ